MGYNYNKREEVPQKYQWDLTSRYKSVAAWQNDLKEAKSKVSVISKYKGKLFESDNLYHALEEFYNYENLIVKLYHYANLRSDEDLSIEINQTMKEEVLETEALFMENSSFFLPEIIHSPNFDIDALIKSDPKLKRFKHKLEEIAKEVDYTKDEETEKIISILTKDMDYYDNISATLLNSNLDYGKIKDENGNLVPLTTANYRKFVTSENRALRKKAYIQMNKKRAEYANIIGKNLLAFMLRHASIAKIRGYKSTKDMDFKNDGVPIEVHDALKKNSKRGLDLFRSFYDIRKNLLKVKVLKPYDLNAPVVKNEKKYTVEEAEEYLIKALSPLGEDYVSILKEGFKNHWIDYMPYKGKQTGGYCCTTYPNSYNILMSFHEDFDSISTIAHEMGHAINSYYTYPNVTIEYSGYDLYTCEIASLLNEILLADYVINNDFSKDEKISVLMHILRTINGNFFTAIMENELEDIVYEKLDKNEVLSSSDLSNIMDDLTSKYYGNSLDRGEYFKYMWIVRSHYFTPWYLYKYATCLCGSVYFASKILKGDKDTLKTYKEFLTVGTDKFPNDILLDLGIDLTKENIYNELFDYYEKLLNKLKELVKDGENNG